MRIEPFCTPNRVFRLKNGTGAKFFYLDPSKPKLPYVLLHDGELLHYDSSGQYLGQENHERNVLEVMPPATWGRSLEYCKIGQPLLLRDYRFATLTGTKPGNLGLEFLVTDEAGVVSVHGRHGWDYAQDSSRDVMASFDAVVGASPESYTHLLGIRSLLDRLEQSFKKPDKKTRQEEYDRVSTGMSMLLGKIAGELESI